MEILKLQSEVDNAKVLMVKEKKTSETMTARERRKRQRWLQSVENLKAVNLPSFPRVRYKSHLRGAEETAADPTETAGGSRLCPGTTQ